MSTMILTAYLMIWPMIVAGVLYVLCSNFIREWREARRDGRPLV
ncbi:MAG TPA: putative transporter small subunit [Sphingopyxis sp.]|nr:putative transporter small subunit [Sphingopyxis sp.]